MCHLTYISLSMWYYYYILLVSHENSRSKIRFLSHFKHFQRLSFLNVPLIIRDPSIGQNMIPEITKSCMYIFNNFHLLKAILGKIRLLFLWEYWMGVRFLFIIEVVDIHSVCNSWYRPFVPMKPSTLPFRQSTTGQASSYTAAGASQLYPFAQQSLNQFQMPKVIK